MGCTCSKDDTHEPPLTALEQHEHHGTAVAPSEGLPQTNERDNPPSADQHRAQATGDTQGCRRGADYPRVQVTIFVRRPQRRIPPGAVAVAGNPLQDTPTPEQEQVLVHHYTSPQALTLSGGERHEMDTSDIRVTVSPPARTGVLSSAAPIGGRSSSHLSGTGRVADDDDRAERALHPRVTRSSHLLVPAIRTKQVKLPPPEDFIRRIVPEAKRKRIMLDTSNISPEKVATVRKWMDTQALPAAVAELKEAAKREAAAELKAAAEREGKAALEAAAALETPADPSGRLPPEI